MADIILPDDVFENMQHAQEAAERMNAAVDDFNKKVDEKFKAKDASEGAKVKEKVNPVLTGDEKRRYRNIGNAFFEGAKNQIIDIFKQIEKNKKKNLFSRAVASVKEKVEAIKEFAEEHKTGGKILLAIAAIGGIYVLFKDWFDKHMPEIWEKMKDAVMSFADSAEKLASEIGKKITESNLLSDIKNFIVETANAIKNFFETLGSKLTSLFSAFSSSENKYGSNTADSIKKQDDFEKRRKEDLVYDAVVGAIGKGADGTEGIKNTIDMRRQHAEQKDRLLAELAAGNVSEERREYIESKLEKLTKSINNKDKIIAEYSETVKGAVDAINNQHNSLLDTFQKGIKEGNKEIVNGPLAEMAKIIGTATSEEELTESQKSALRKIAIDNHFLDGFAEEAGKHWLWANDSDGQNSLEELGKNIYDLNTKNKAVKQIQESSAISIALKSREALKNNGKSKEEIEEEKRLIQKTVADNEKKIQSINRTKLAHVAVISSLDEFVRNFFDSDKPGSFKDFSKTFLESIKQIADNFKVGVTITKHINSLHDKVNSLIDNINENIEVIVETLNSDTQSVKDFITEKFKEEGLSVLDDTLQDIVKKEQEQINCLVEQNNILKQTNNLLSNVGSKNNSFNIVNSQSNDSDINIADMPQINGSVKATSLSIVSGEV